MPVLYLLRKSKLNQIEWKVIRDDGFGRKTVNILIAQFSMTAQVDGI